MEQSKGDNGEAIAKSIFEMARLKVPIIAIVIGEGSSGGALALGVANQVFMLENAIYSILSPEGFASILWKDASRTKEAAEKMKLTAKDLLELEIIDKVIKEPKYETKESFQKVADCLRNEIKSAIIKMQTMSKADILEHRYSKFRNMGKFEVLREGEKKNDIKR